MGYYRIAQHLLLLIGALMCCSGLALIPRPPLDTPPTQEMASRGSSGTLSMDRRGVLIIGAVSTFAGFLPSVVALPLVRPRVQDIGGCETSCIYKCTQRTRLRFMKPARAEAIENVCIRSCGGSITSSCAISPPKEYAYTPTLKPSQNIKTLDENWMKSVLGQ